MKVGEKQKLEGGILYRNENISGVVDAEKRLVELTFSSEHPVVRSSFFGEPWVEILGHDAGEVDMFRLKNGAPVLFNHNSRERDAHIGVVESAEISGGKGKATIRLSQRPEIDDIFQDVNDGILRNVSVGYTISERTLVREVEGGPDEFRVNRWVPHEVSLVTIGADPNVGVGRSESDEQMMYRILDDDSGDSSEGETDVNDDNLNREVEDMTPEEQAKLEKEAAERAAEIAHKRTADIMDIFSLVEDTPEVRTLKDNCIKDSTITADQASRQLLEIVGKESESLCRDDALLEPGQDEKDKFRRGAELTLSERAGVLGKDEKPDTENNFRGFTLVELARKACDIAGVSYSGIGKQEMVGRAFTSTDDFPLLLANTSHKSLMIGYNETEETFQAWTKRGSLSDFKTWNRNVLSAFENLELVREGSEYKFGNFDEFGEAITLGTYGKMFPMTRQAIINDDLSAFTDVPRGMGRAAIRTVGNVAYSALTSNANMSDGNPLFDAAHTNLNSGGAAAFTAASFSAARNAMVLQTDPSGNAVVGVRPRYVLCPVNIEDTVRKVLRSATEVGQSNPEVINPVQNQAVVISDHRLDTFDNNGWFVVADPRTIETIEVAYLDGNDQPMLEQQGGWNIDGIEYKVRIDVAAKALDWRGMNRNDGA